MKLQVFAVLLVISLGMWALLAVATVLAIGALW